MENNLSLYKIFYTTAETGNISAAAKKLYISQPAVSKAVSKLEQSVGVPLFVRSSKGVTLTYEGQILYENVRNAFENIRSGEEQIRNLVDFNEGHIRFGASTTLCKYVLLPYLKKFMAGYPNVGISIVSQSTYETLRLLEEQKIDIGLIGTNGTTPMLPDSMIYTKIMDIEDIFVATGSYIKAMGTRDIISHSTLLLLNKENITRQYVDHYFFENQVKINQVIEATSLDLLIEFAKIGLGLACVIREFVQPELGSRQLIQIPLKKPIPKRSVGFVRSAGAMPSLSSKRFMEFIEASAEKS